MTQIEPSEAPWFKVGDRLGDFRVVRLIDVGYFSYNLEVQDSINRRFHAVVHKRPDLQPQFTLAGIAFEASLSHPGLPRIVHVGEPCPATRGHVWFVREHLPPPLASTVRETGKPLAADDTLLVGLGVCQLFEYLHDENARDGKRPVVHGFLVPGYIHRADDGVIKVAGMDVQVLIRSGTPVTLRQLAYRSPDCLESAPHDLGGTNDLWALAGCMLYLSTGRPPLNTQASDLAELRAEHDQCVPLQRAQQVQDVRLREILTTAFNPKRTGRFATASELRYEIESALGRPTAAPRHSHEVFVCYERTDHRAAAEVCAACERSFIRCWSRLRDSGPGASREIVASAIAQSRLVLLLYSSETDRSSKALDEVKWAVDRQIPVLAVRIENAAPSPELESLVPASNWIDAFSPSMEASLPFLIEALQSRLTRSVASGETARLSTELKARLAPSDQAFSSQAVVIGYPAPIAIAFRRFLQQTDARTRLDMLFSTFEATLRYLVAVGVADLVHCWIEEGRAEVEFPPHRAFEFLRKPTNMQLGMWIEALRETARELARRHDRFVRELPTVCKPEGPLDAKTFAWLVSQRNRCFHVDGSIALTPDESREAIRQIRPQLEDALQQIHFVCSYPLGFVQPGPSSIGESGRHYYYAHSCMGARVANTTEAAMLSLTAPLQKETPFIGAPDGARLLYLWPLLMQRVAAHTGRHSLYVFERIPDSRRPCLTETVSAAIDFRDLWRQTLHDNPATTHTWLAERLRQWPASPRLPQEARVAEKLLPTRGGKLIGRRLGPNRLTAVIASGGFGTVYAANADTGERVAVKVIESPAAMRHFDRFQYEFAKLKQAAQHVGVVRCFEAGVEVADDGVFPWYSMEFAVGGDLAGRIIERFGDAATKVVWDNPALRSQVIEEFQAIAAAVAHLHGLGVVHRDLKPANVLIMDGGQLKLSDFGLAKSLEPSERSLIEGPRTSTGAILGTRHYMAPEQERGAEAAKPADVYALGVMLAEMATGAKPQPDPRIANGSTLTGFAPLRTLPKELRSLILKCTSVDAGKRPKDAQAVLDRFTSLVKEQANLTGSAPPDSAASG